MTTTKTQLLPEPRIVEPTQRFHADSRPNRLVGLGTGQSASESVRLDFNTSTKEEMDSAIVSLRQTMSKAADQASRRSGYKFVTETGQFITRSGDIVVTAVVTRTA